MEKTAVRIQGRESVAMTTAEFGRLFATWRARFEAIACRYVRSAAVAEDLVSDSFMSFWENRGRIPADANLQAYILIIVRNKCLDWLRAQSLHAKIEQEVYELRRRVLAADIRSLQAFNPEEIFSAEVAAIVRQSLDRLPELTREVFVARRFEELSYKEIAEKYGITVRRVEFELENADEATMTALAQALDQEGWGIKNINFSQEGSYATTDYQHALDPNGSYVVAYVGRNEYGQLSKVKTETFSTKAQVTDNPGASKATIDITISDPGRTSLKLTYTYNQETAVYYHQYIMTPDLLEEANKAELIKYLMSENSNIWAANANGGVENFKWTGLNPGTEYTFAYMAEDWDGVLTDVKIVKATTEAIIAGPNPTMQLNAYMSDLGNFTVQYSIVKDVAKLYYSITEDNYSASGDYTYQECMDVWKEHCLDYGLSGVNSTTQSYDKTSEAKRLVALCVPIGADADGNEVIGDLYTVFYDKEKGIITDPSVLFPDAPKLKKGIKGIAKPQVVKKDNRVPAKLIVNEQVKVNTPGVMRSESVIYLDLKKLGKHPHSK